MSIRATYFLGFAIAILIFLVSVYLQFIDGILPCPLCVFQRATFGLIGIMFLFGMLLCGRKPMRYFINLVGAIASILGIILASRQIFLQHYPPPQNECGVSLQYMMQTFPLNEVLKKIFFEGSAECTERGWEFLSLNMAEWSLVWFILFLTLYLLLFSKESKTMI